MNHEPYCDCARCNHSRALRSLVLDPRPVVEPVAGPLCCNKLEPGCGYCWYCLRRKKP